MINDLHVRIFEMHQELGRSAGINSLQDRYNVGYLQALVDVINTDIDDVKGEANGN